MKPKYKLSFPKHRVEGRLEATYEQMFDLLSTYKEMVSCGAEPEYIGVFEWDGIEWQRHNIKHTLTQLNKMLGDPDTKGWWVDDNTD